MAIQKGGWRKFWHYARLPVVILLIVWGGFVLVEVKLPVSKARSDAAVAAIHAQRLTMADVDGTNLPPEPDPKKNNATVAGIDANENGIRDDVELSLFNAYSSQSKSRAAALQYALALQTRLTHVINGNTWEAAVYKKSRSYNCISDSTGYRAGVERLRAAERIAGLVKDLVLNTEMRKLRDEKLEKFATVAESAQGDTCDVYKE